MSCTELAADIARRAEVSTGVVEGVLVVPDAAVIKGAARGERVTWAALLTLNVVDRRARTGRNPREGACCRSRPAAFHAFGPGSRRKNAVGTEN